MAEIVGSMAIDMAICGKGTGLVYGRVCGTASYDLLPMLELRGEGRVSSTIRSKRARADIELVISGSNKGIVRRVVRGSGRASFSLEFGAKAKGMVRSKVTGYGELSIEPNIKPYPKPGRVLTPIYSTTKLEILLSHWGSFLPEIGMPVLNESTQHKLANQSKVEIRVLKEYVSSHEFHGDRRNWLIAQVTYERCPIMFIVNSGWQGITYPTRYIVDRNRYQYMLHYLFTMMTPDRGADEYWSTSGMVHDRIKTVQPEFTNLNDLPLAIKRLIHEFGDW